jgi:CubicO group peptidase (beta-lactamase class C family)
VKIAPRCWRTILILLAALALPARPARALDSQAVDQIVQDSLQAWQVPGASLAIVHNDRVVYLQGYGVRKLGSKSKVTADTLFGIASLTKAFTTTALAMLADEGKLRWDDPVRKHVPFFRLADPLADENVTLRDLVCHRTGVNRHDLLWYRAPWSPEETVRRLAHVKPSHSFRAVYQYNNIMYLAAGFAVASASKMTWHDFVRQRIFTPLGMKGATFTRSAVMRTPDHASPHHQDKDGKVSVMPWYDDDQQIRASGSIKAGARDLANWVRFQLGDGTFGGKRLLSARALAETHTPQMVIRLVGPMRAMFPEATQLSYALGWQVHDYRGHALWSHTGSTDGFRSCIVLVPRARLGIVLLMNSDGGTGRASMHLAVTHRLLDRLLGLASRDWDDYYAGLVKKERDEQRAREQARLAKRRQGTTPSHPLDAYTGTYQEPAYGKASLTLDKGVLVLRWSGFVGRLEHFHFDTFTVKTDRPVGGEQVVFDQGEDGSVAAMHFLGVTFQKKP